jgi:OFA family oxalate/formate antiporter-like MFS transporter
MSEKVTNRWMVVFGAIIIQLCLGAVYAWSLFNQPLIDKFQWEKGDVVLTFSITIFMMATFTIVGGKIQDKIGPRWVATAGGIIMGAGIMLASTATSLTELYLYYGFIGGAGIGMAYVCPLATCQKWFPDKRGLISGIAVAGFGGGALVFKPFILTFIGNVGVSSTFFYLGIVYLIAVVIGAQFLVVPPAGYSPPGWTPPVVSASSAGNDFSTGQMLKNVQFYYLWIVFLFACTAGLMVIGLAKDIGINLVHLNAADAANAVVVVATFNALGRVIWGSLSDKLGRVNSLFVMYLIAGLAMFLMSSITMTYFTFLGLCSLIGFCFGGFLALFPSLTADYYGTKNFGTNYGIMFMAFGIAAIVGPKIGTSGTFSQAFLIAAVLCMVSAGMTFLVRETPKLT